MKPLAERLLLKPDMAAAIVAAPDDVAAELPVTRGLKIPGKGKVSLDWLLVFVRDRAAIARIASQTVRALKGDGVLWLAYPKLSGALQTDVTRDNGWEPMRALGFDTVAAVAIDETWSALRFRANEMIGRRRADHPSAS
jgi:hypothetical protein